jgi:hypothetical protein
MKLGTKSKVRMEIVHKEKQLGAKLVFSTELVLLTHVSPLGFGFSFLVSAHNFHEGEGSQNKIPQFF